MAYRRFNKRLENMNLLDENERLQRILNKIVKRVERFYISDGELQYLLRKCQSSVGWLISYARLIDELEKDEFVTENADD